MESPAGAFFPWKMTSLEILDMSFIIVDIFSYSRKQEIEVQHAVFPAAQWSKKLFSACAMDDYVKVLYFTRVEK